MKSSELLYHLIAAKCSRYRVGELMDDVLEHSTNIDHSIIANIVDESVFLEAIISKRVSEQQS